jgi:esterase FrsA
MLHANNPRSIKNLAFGLFASALIASPAVMSEEGGDPFIPDTPLFEEDNWYRDLRVGHWLTGGTSITQIERVLRRVQRGQGERRIEEWADTQVEYGPGNWVYEWSRAASNQEKTARTHEAQGRLSAARRHYLKAANLYGIAKYPHLNTQEDDSAYKAQLRAYEAAGRLFDQPLEVIEIVVNDTAINGYLHLPPQASEDKPVPVALISGGIDVFKAEFRLLVEELNSRGVAAFTHDMKSTGEATTALLKNDYYEYHLAYAEELAMHPFIDGSRMAIYGQSYGGNPVAKLAVDFDDVFSAAVVACAPIDLPFVAFAPADLPFAVAPMTLDILEARFRTGSCDLTDEGLQQCEQVIDQLDEFALGSTLTSGTIDIPLLVPAPENDPFMPEPDIELLSSAATAGFERLVTGQDIHCTRERNTYWPQIAEWIASSI